MRDTIEWTPDLKIGVKQIDEQHREMFAEFNKLAQAVRAEKGADEVGRMVEFCAKYTLEHFNAEENIMEKYDFPRFGWHKKAHDEFATDVVKVIRDYEAGGKDSQLALEIVEKLDEWIRHHIKNMDKELADHLRSKLRPSQ